MLQLRPACEHCNKRLPPDSTQAMICTYECTFCTDCVTLLKNVCPNCGGGFCSRPHRPSKNLKDGNYLSAHPASSNIIHNPVKLSEHRVFVRKIKDIPPHAR